MRSFSCVAPRSMAVKMAEYLPVEGRPQSCPGTSSELEAQIRQFDRATIIEVARTIVQL
jgi:hypothetical protein